MTQCLLLKSKSKPSPIERLKINVFTAMSKRSISDRDEVSHIGLFRWVNHTGRVVYHKREIGFIFV
jgi:hypothetical protein